MEILYLRSLKSGIYSTLEQHLHWQNKVCSVLHQNKAWLSAQQRNRIKPIRIKPNPGKADNTSLHGSRGSAWNWLLQEGMERAAACRGNFTQLSWVWVVPESSQVPQQITLTRGSSTPCPLQGEELHFEPLRPSTAQNSRWAIFIWGNFSLSALLKPVHL